MCKLAQKHVYPKLHQPVDVAISLSVDWSKEGKAQWEVIAACSVDCAYLRVPSRTCVCVRGSCAFEFDLGATCLLTPLSSKRTVKQL